MKFRLSSSPMSWALLSGAFAIFTVCLAPAAQAVTRSVAFSGTSSAQTGAHRRTGLSESSRSTIGWLLRLQAGA